MKMSHLISAIRWTHEGSEPRNLTLSNDLRRVVMIDELSRRFHHELLGYVWIMLVYCLLKNCLQSICSQWKYCTLNANKNRHKIWNHLLMQTLSSRGVVLNKEKKVFPIVSNSFQSFFFMPLTLRQSSDAGKLFKPNSLPMKNVHIVLIYVYNC